MAELCLGLHHTADDIVEDTDAILFCVVLAMCDDDYSQPFTYLPHTPLSTTKISVTHSQRCQPLITHKCSIN